MSLEELAMAYAGAVTRCYPPRPVCSDMAKHEYYGLLTCWERLCKEAPSWMEDGFDDYADTSDGLCPACAAYRDVRHDMKAARLERGQLRRLLATYGRRLLRIEVVS